jgi:transposase-like protein
VKTKENIKNLTLCPLCGSKLSPILSGSGVRNRKRCTRCNRTFV